MRDSLMTGKSLVASFFRCLPSQPAVIAADWVGEIFRNWYFTCTLSIRTVVPLVFYQIRMKSHQRQIMNILWVWNIFTSSSRSSNAYKNENWKIQNWDWNINVEWDKKTVNLISKCGKLNFVNLKYYVLSIYLSISLYIHPVMASMNFVFRN